MHQVFQSDGVLIIGNRDLRSASWSEEVPDAVFEDFAGDRVDSLRRSLLVGLLEAVQAYDSAGFREAF